MMDRRHYDRYKKLLDKLDYDYKGYQLKKLIPGYLTSFFSDDPISTKEIFKEFYLGTQFYDLNKIFAADAPSVISYLINRSDYRELAVAAQRFYPESEVLNIESFPQVKRSPFSLSYLKSLCKASRIVFFRSIDESFMTKLFLIGIITRLFNYISLIESLDAPTHISRYICFNTAYKEESLLTLYFQKRNVETITLQHGIFCDFKKVIPFDCINFENLIADKILCWGQSTIDYLSSNGIDASRLILAGNPKYKDIQITSVDQSFTRCLVLLGRQLYVSSNDLLLSTLKEYNQKSEKKILFYIKKHPFLMDEDHKSFADVADNIIFLGKEHSVQQLLKSDLVNFTIAVNTTAYYESLALGKISLRWSESENEDFYGMDDKFYDLTDFEQKIKEFQSKSKISVKEEMVDVIKYVFNPNL